MEIVLNDENIQMEIAVLQNAGVVVKAYIACDDRYKAVKKLKTLGIEVISTGLPLTQFPKAHDCSVITV